LFRDQRAHDAECATFAEIESFGSAPGRSGLPVIVGLVPAEGMGADRVWWAVATSEFPHCGERGFRADYPEAGTYGSVG
uniref:hypothetical protein n=1 Tax=Sedimentibacter sp. B4 TaxID=304766 RepID=UPI00058EF303